MGYVDHGDAQISLNFFNFKAHGLRSFASKLLSGLSSSRLAPPLKPVPGQHAAAARLTIGWGSILAQVHDIVHMSQFFDGGLSTLAMLRIGHVIEYVHVRPYGVALEHHAHTTLFRRHEHLVRRYQGFIDINFSR